MQYIGSTISKLSKRLSDHKADFKRWKNGNKHYLSSFKILEGDNYSIVLIEKVNCNSKTELEKREMYYIQTLECVNMIVPSKISLEENYYKNYDKAYNEKHKEEIKAKKIAKRLERKEKERKWKEEDSKKDNIITIT